MFFACDKADKAAKLAGAARIRIGNDLGLVKADAFELCWIVDFPMYEWNEEEKKIDFSHNPFSMPQGGLEALETQDPLTIKAFQYDIVCNGIELSSGAIRNHRPDVMKKAFAIAGYGEEVLLEKFGGMYRAFQCGAPPHGGIAPGVDRIVMLLAGEENLREVVLFPMNQRAEDLMMGAPAEVTPKQLRELHIRLNLPEKWKGSPSPALLGKVARSGRMGCGPLHDARSEGRSCFAQRRTNALDDHRQSTDDEFIWKSKNAKSLASKPRIPLGVPALRIRRLVRAAVRLDDELPREANEVREIGSDRRLPAKAATVDPMIAHCAPKHGLRSRHVLTLQPSELAGGLTEARRLVHLAWVA